MPFYRDLDAATVDGRRAIERLLALRRQAATLPGGVPPKTLSETLLIATWNIRDFDSPSFGQRSDEAIRYIAEIIDKFDIVAIQEVNKDLTGLKRVLDVLGPMYKYLATDVTEGSAGNGERLVFVYDSRKVRLGGVVAELVLPGDQEQLARTPFMVGFVSGWARFFLASVHIRWGTDDADDPARVAEIQQVARLLAGRAEDKDSWARNVILIGDFNIFSTEDDTFRALTDNGFVVPPPIMGAYTNAKLNRSYDQIAFHTDPDRLTWTENAGVLDYFQTVFTEADHPAIYDGFLKADGLPPSNPASYYSTYWRTHQMSDHLPLWCELRIDYSDEYLQRKLERHLPG